MRHHRINYLLRLLFISIFFILLCPIRTTLAAVNTSTPTNVLVQTQQETPGTVSPTQTAEATQSLTPTTTLAPLPAITLIFPAHTSTPTKTISSSTLTATPTYVSTVKDRLNEMSPRLRILTAVIILLWITLAGFLLLYLRQIK